MKVLKFIGIILVVAIVGLLVAAGLAPKDYKVERSIAIDASNQSVLPYITNLQKMQEWSPWASYDPNMEVNYEGDLGQVGSKSIWSGNKDVGKGSQEITNVSDDLVEIKLKFVEPFQSEADVYFQTAKDGESTKVTWGMSGENDFMARIFGLFMNMEEMIGADYDRGLATLKELVERNTISETDGLVIESISFEPKVYLIKREKVKFDKIQSFFAKHFGGLFGGLGKAGIEPTGAPSAIYYMWDEENMEADMAAAAPIGDDSIELDGYESLTVDQSNALKVAYYGAYEDIGSAHEAMDKYMVSNGLEFNEICIEEYITDPGSEPDTSKWLTNIYYLTK
jgi:effector-binding domain-containing protein